MSIEREDADFHESVAYLIRTAFRAFRRLMQSGAKSAGVSLQEWYLLRVVPERGSLTQRELSERADAFESNAVAVVRALAQRGLLLVVRDLKDRRYSRITLTGAGADARQALLDVSRSLNTVALQGFSEREVAIYQRLTGRIIANLSRLRSEL